MTLLNFDSFPAFKEDYQVRLAESVKSPTQKRERKGSEVIAVGNKDFVESTKKQLNTKAFFRDICKNDDVYELREAIAPYGQSKGE